LKNDFEHCAILLASYDTGGASATMQRGQITNNSTMFKKLFLVGYQKKPKILLTIVVFDVKILKIIKNY
jgi:hypothetical protein